MNGRPPKPKRLHDLHGNPSKITRKKLASEPVARGSLKRSPDWLTAEQKAAWRYATTHAPAGILRAIDRGALAVWVVAEDTHRKAATSLETAGLLVRQGEQIIPNPFLSIMNKQAAVMLKAAELLGFTPVGRARMRTATGLELPPDDPSPNAGATEDEFETHMASKPTIN